MDKKIILSALLIFILINCENKNDRKVKVLMRVNKVKPFHINKNSPLSFNEFVNNFSEVRFPFELNDDSLNNIALRSGKDRGIDINTKEIHNFICKFKSDSCERYRGNERLIYEYHFRFKTENRIGLVYSSICSRYINYIMSIYDLEGDLLDSKQIACARRENLENPSDHEYTLTAKLFSPNNIVLKRQILSGSETINDKEKLYLTIANSKIEILPNQLKEDTISVVNKIGHFGKDSIEVDN
jgi:hypothetical protein